MLQKTLILTTIVMLTQIRNSAQPRTDLGQLFNCEKDVCYMVTPTNDEDYDNYCWTLDPDARHVISNEVMDPNSYLNFAGSHLKIFEDKQYLVFYNCPNHKTFTYVHQNNYTILGSTPSRQTFRFGHIVYHPPNNEFQLCLQYYCTKNVKHFFNCVGNLITTLNLKLNTVVTLSCLETITYVNINSSKLVDINTSTFFKYAINIIKLTITASKHVKMIKCDLFHNMTSLKLLEIPYLNQELAFCILKSNPNLARLSNGTDRIWNICNDTYDVIDRFDFNRNVTFANRLTSQTDSLTVLFVFVAAFIGLFALILIAKYLGQIYDEIWRHQVVSSHSGCEVEIGIIGLLIVIAGMFGSLFCGLILDKTHLYKETTLMIYAMSLMGTIIFSASLKYSLTVIGLAAILLGFFMTGLLPVGFEFATELTYPESEGTTTGILNAIVQIFGISITNLYGLLLKYDNDMWANAFLSVVLVIGLMITLCIKSNLLRQAAEK